MRVTFFPSCITDTFYAEGAVDAVRLLRSLGVHPHVEDRVVCCGQAAHNAGFEREARATMRHVRKALPVDAPVVVASGSCAAMMAHEYGPTGPRVFELAQFVVDVLGRDRLGDGLRGLRVAYHHGCHALRALGIRTQPIRLLKNAGAVVVPWEADSECCGFGGLFSAKHPEVSTAMADRKIDTLPDVDVLTSADGGCLLQLSGRMAERGSGPPAIPLATLLWRAGTGPAGDVSP